MDFMQRWLGLKVLVVMGCLLGAPDARACRCAFMKSDREAFAAARAGASVLFRGRVEDIQLVGGELSGQYRVTFTVTETFKGKATSQRLVTTSAAGTACGYSFAKGADYLVYAGSDEKGGLSTDSCSRTRPADRAAADLVSLRGGPSPFLQRPKVSCTRCALEAIARTLVCTGAERCPPLAREQARTALGQGQPFWTLEPREGSRPPRVSGVAWDGRAFVLESRQAGNADDVCTTFVLRRGCERLSMASPADKTGLVCVGGRSQESLCDELETRRP